MGALDSRTSGEHESITFRFLEKLSFIDIYQAFLEAFSDYTIPMNLTEKQFRELLARRGAKARYSVGAFEKGKMIGFNLNAVDVFDQELTVYDVATGILPPYRGKRIASGLFEFSLPRLRKRGVKRYLLEVLETNQRAIRAYERIGFKIRQILSAFHRTRKIAFAVKQKYSKTNIREIKPRWRRLQTFWDWKPSWQNSIRSLQRTKTSKRVLGAFSGGKLAGYIIFFPATGDVPQFAVNPSNRRSGLASALFESLQKELKEIRVVNVPSTATDTIVFLESLGLKLFIRQFEMIMDLH